MEEPSLARQRLFMRRRIKSDPVLSPLYKLELEDADKTIAHSIGLTPRFRRTSQPAFIYPNSGEIVSVNFNSFLIPILLIPFCCVRTNKHSWRGCHFKVCTF